MTNQTPTNDELSRGMGYWKNQERRGLRMFQRTNWNGRWDAGQALLNKVSWCREVAQMCPTYSPCSRECI